MTHATPIHHDPTAEFQRQRTLLEASAGTGKTYTIASLFVRLVAEEGLGVESILVVTFTEAATSELRERIRSRVREALAVVQLQQPPGQDRTFQHLVELGARDPAAQKRHVAHLSVALESFDRASISTIHGFCRRVLGESAFESGTEFDLELVGQPRELMADLVQEYWTREMHEVDPAWIEALKSRKFNLKNSLELAMFVSEHPDTGLTPAPEAPCPNLHEPWLNEREAVRSLWDAEAAQAYGFLESLIGAGVVSRTWFSFDSPEELSESWERIAQFVHADTAPENGLLHELWILDGRKLDSRKNKKASPVVWFTTSGGVPGNRLFNAVSRWVERDQALSQELDAEVVRQRHQLAETVRRDIPRRKRELHQQSFSDLLLSLRAQVMDPVAGDVLCAAIRERYAAVLIDEFQDTDPVQWDIFRSVFDQQGAVFTLIGDPKQAIYSFRGADIHTYIRVAGSTPLESQRTLGVNYRTDAGLVEATNHLFHRNGAFDEPFGDSRIPFHPVEPHHGDDRLEMAEDLDFAPLQIRHRPRPDPSKAMAANELTDAVLQSMAAEMSAILQSGSRIRPDSDAAWRSIHAGDFAVLVSTNAQAREVQSILRGHGIPGVLQGTSSVFESADAQEFVHLLQAVVNPRNRRSVHSALVTRLIGVDAVALATLHDGTEWEAWVGRFREWGRIWEEEGFLAMSRRLVAELSVHERLLRFGDGERRVTNLLHLVELCHAECASSSGGPEGLLSWLKSQMGPTAESDDVNELRLESDAEAVTIITIHRSKGLEYPFVWCPHLWSPRDNKTPQSGIRYHDEGSSWLHVDKPSTEAGKKAVERWKREKWREELRLLYVALTRARHGCVLYWGRTRDSVRSPLCWVFHQDTSPPNGDGKKAVENRFKKMTDESIRGDLDAIASSSNNRIAIRELIARRGESFQQPVSGEASLDARVYSRVKPLDGDWRRASYSAMIRGSWDAGEGAHRDHDAHVEDDSETPVGSSSQVQVPLHDFPRGARAGTFLHHVLEHLDFQDTAGLEELVRTSLTRHGFEADTWTEKVVLGIEAALKTDLQDVNGAPHTLADIPSSHRYNELDFDLSVAGGPAVVDAAAIARVFEEHARPEAPVEYATRLKALRFVPLRGFLTGSIDLVYRHEGRFHVADHKSNFLGTHAHDYPHAAMSEAMQHHHYLLQSHLYTVALHRYLQWRMGLDVYDYDTHVGGVRYLFLRGMVGPGEHGVFRDRPSAAMIHALDRVLAGEGGGR